MTPMAALGFTFIGSVIGFLAGIFVTLAHPIYRKAWHQSQMAKEARKGVNQSMVALLDLMKQQGKASGSVSKVDTQ